MMTKQKEMEEGQKPFLTRISEAADKVGATLDKLNRKAEAAGVFGLSDLSVDLRYIEEVVREQIAAMRSASFAEVNRQFLAAQASSAAVVQAAMAGVDIAKRQEATEPVPAFVYYDRENSNFYSMHDRSGMGWEFFWKWKDRWQEFPTEPPAPAAASLVAEQAPAPIPSGVYYSPHHRLFFDSLTGAVKAGEFKAEWLSRAAEFPQRWGAADPASKSYTYIVIAMSEEEARQKIAAYYGLPVSTLDGWSVSTRY